MANKFLLFVLTFFIFTSCTDRWTPDVVENALGKIPVYATTSDASTISPGSPQEIQLLGKIYYKYPYLYAIEISKGIHVINNEDPTTPQKVKFINVPGIGDMAIKGNYLFVDNISDLVTIDISDISNIREVSRIEDACTDGGSKYPLGYVGYFECPDPDKGIVVGWVDGYIDKPDCYTR